MLAISDAEGMRFALDYGSHFISIFLRSVSFYVLVDCQSRLCFVCVTELYHPQSLHITLNDIWRSGSSKVHLSNFTQNHLTEFCV